MVGRIDLGVGAVARAILSEPYGKRGARTVLGAATVKVVDPHVDGRYDVFVVEILSSSEAGRFGVGRQVEIDRHDLFATSEPAEADAFLEMVTAIWDRGPAGDAARARVFAGAR